MLFRISTSARMIGATALAVAATACGGDGDPDVSSASTVPQVGNPTAASVAVKDLALTLNEDTSISPSGLAVASPAGGQWCLEDDSGVRCVDALAEGSAAHGVVWSADETAIAVTWGSQNPMSIIDFDEGTSVETSLTQHRLLAFTADGSSIVGLDIDVDDQISKIDPVTLEASKFADLIPDAGVPQLFGTGDLYWGSLPGVATVFTLTDGADPDFIEGGLGEQLLVSVTADRRLALAMDNEIARGRGEPGDTMLRIFDRAEQRSVGVQLPAEIDERAPNAAQLSADGRSLLVLHNVDGGMALSSAAIDPETLDATGWTQLASWEGGDPDVPAVYRANALMRWTGGTTALILTDNDKMLEVTLG